MRILKLSIGNAVLQHRHMPYIAVSAGLILTTQFYLPRTVATVLNQGLLISKYVCGQVHLTYFGSLNTVIGSMCRRRPEPLFSVRAFARRDIFVISHVKAQRYSVTGNTAAFYLPYVTQ